MQQGLALFWPTTEVAFEAVIFHLCSMALECFPSLDLPRIIVAPSAHIVPAVPLEPPTRVFRVDPSFFYPVGKWLTRIDAEEVEVFIVFLVAELCVFIPIIGKFIATIGHIFTTEHAHFQKLFRSKFGLKFRIEILAHGFGELVGIPLLHQVIDGDGLAHRFTVFTKSSG